MNVVKIHTQTPIPSCYNPKGKRVAQWKEWGKFKQYGLRSSQVWAYFHSYTAFPSTVPRLRLMNSWKVSCHELFCPLAVSLASSCSYIWFAHGPGANSPHKVHGLRCDVRKTETAWANRTWAKLDPWAKSPVTWLRHGRHAGLAGRKWRPGWDGDPSGRLRRQQRRPKTWRGCHGLTTGRM